MRVYTQRPDHNTGNYVPYSLRTVSGFFNVPLSELFTNKGCETGPTVYRPYPRRHVSALIPIKEPLRVSQADDPKVYLICFCVFQVIHNINIFYVMYQTQEGVFHQISRH